MKYLSKYITYIKEDFDLANKLYFKTNIITGKQKDLILSITNNDNYTKLLCDIVYTINKIDTFMVEDFKKYLNDTYTQLKEYNKNYFPIKDFNKKDITNLSPYVFEYRQEVIDNMKKLPSIAIRNLKNDIRIERDTHEFSNYGDKLNYCLGLYGYLLNRPEEIRDKILKKLFKNNITLDDLSNFLEDKYNIIGGVKMDKKTILKIIDDDYSGQLDLIYDENNIMIVEVSGPNGIKKIGSNSLWCFTYGNDNFDVWYRNQKNGIVYVIFNLNKKSDSEDFMYVLLEPLNYNPDENEFEEDEKDDFNEYKLYNMMNDDELHPLIILDNLIGLEKSKELFTFGIEQSEEELELLNDVNKIKSKLNFKGDNYEDKICKVELFPSKLKDNKIFIRGYNKQTNKTKETYIKPEDIQNFIGKLHNYELFESKIKIN
jgi:hypothetical protein